MSIAGTLQISVAFATQNQGGTSASSQFLSHRTDGQSSPKNLHLHQHQGTSGFLLRRVWARRWIGVECSSHPSPPGSHARDSPVPGGRRGCKHAPERLQERNVFFLNICCADQSSGQQVERRRRRPEQPPARRGKPPPRPHGHHTSQSVRTFVFISSPLRLLFPRSTSPASLSPSKGVSERGERACLLCGQQGAPCRHRGHHARLHAPPLHLSTTGRSRLHFL